MSDDPPSQYLDAELMDRLDRHRQCVETPMEAWRARVLRRDQELADIDPGVALADTEVDQRWNPFGIRTMYASLERETAAAEGARQSEAQRATETTRLAMVIFKLVVVIGEAVDLSDPEVLREEFGIDLRPGRGAPETYVQRTEDATITQEQRVGASVHHLGIPALLVPSVQRYPHTNIVLFANNQQVDDYWDVDEDEDVALLDE